MSYQVELLHNFLREFLQPDSAVISMKEDVLALHSQDPVTCGTLATAASTVLRYMKPQPGDIILLNDPYSGGSVLSSFTFITALNEDLLWVKSIPRQGQWKVATSVEDEGLRIPPTPLRQNGQLNEMILTAMRGHPSCPTDLVDWLRQQCDLIAQDSEKFLHTAQTVGLQISPSLVTEYLHLSRQVAFGKISEKASGDARLEVRLDKGDLIRLKMEVNEGHLRLDFSGTSTSRTVNLTDAATYGTCLHWLAHYYGFEDFINSGTFALVQVSKPVGCLLQSKYPAPTIKGMSDGVAALQLILQLTMNQIHTKSEVAPCGTSALRLQLQAGSEKVLLTLPGGKGAQAQHEGRSAEGLCESLSIECLEKKLPLLVRRISYRDDDRAPAKHQGGKGLTLQLQILKDMELSWMSDLNLHRPRISKNCSHGAVNTLLLHNAEGFQNLPCEGQLILKAGDLPEFSSSSGGGFGKPS